jgi:ATP-binding cassette, subfamily B, bacterial HlyB/CyaB
MIHVDTQLESLLPLLWAAFPWRDLPPPQRSAVVTQLQLCAFQPGQLIYPPRELPSLIHCIVQGRVRLLGPSHDDSPTLAIADPGTVIGWDSLVRRVAVGTARAAMPAIAAEAAAQSQEVLTLALAADVFESLAVQWLMPTLAQQVSALELFDVLSQFVAILPQGPTNINLKQVVKWVLAEQLAQVQYWKYPDRRRLGSANGIYDDFPSEFAPDHLWLISSGECADLPIGKPIDPHQDLPLTQTPRFPVRLVGINRTVIQRMLSPGTLTWEAVQPSPVQLFLPAAVQSTGSSAAISRPAWGEPLPRDASPTATLSSSYTVWKSVSPDRTEDLVACFGMVCDRLQIPYRPDSLRRSLQQHAIDRMDPFDLYCRIAQALGIEAHIVNFTPTSGGLNRLPTPALIQCSEVFVVLQEVTPKTTVVGSPRTGLLQLKPEHLVTRLTLEPGYGGDRTPAHCRAIVLDRLATTPIQRFGFRWFVPLVAKQKGILVQVLLASIVIQLLGLANPLLIQQVIDHVIINANAGAMSMFGSLMVMFALLEGILTILRTYLLISTTNRMDLHLGVEIVRHLLHLPLIFFEQRPVGELSARLLELENIRQFMTDTAITTVMDVVFSIFYVAVMCLYSVKLTLGVLATIPIVIISTLLMSTVQRKLIRVKSEQGAKVQSYMVEVLGGIASVKAQHMENLVEATWRDRYVQYLSTGFTTSTANTIFYSYSQFLNTVSSLLVLWMGAEVVLKGEMTLGGLIAFRILTGYVTGPLLRLARLWQRFQETALSMDLLADIADSPVESELTAVKAGLRMPEILGQVQYHNVSFGFKPGQKQLSQVTLEIMPGTFVGIVGQSGSGKSTLMKLLPRLYLPQSGTITIDGYDVSKVDLDTLRSQVGIVSQDAVLFQGTIRDNIALFSDIADQEIIEAARIAEAHDFIMQLPDGYATEIGERGASLSGGQRQRIAIARVVLRNPRLLIFDEATSALDYETERQVCKNLMQRFQGRTCFFITHRLNTIAHADWILYMQSGIIAEQGTHTDLMANRQLYYCLYAQQSREA